MGARERLPQLQLKAAFCGSPRTARLCSRGITLIPRSSCIVARSWHAMVGWDSETDRMVTGKTRFAQLHERKARPPTGCAGGICFFLPGLRRPAHLVVKPLGPSHVAIQEVVSAGEPHTAARVLYAVGHYPQLSETYIETERSACAVGRSRSRYGGRKGTSHYPISVPVHDGTLAEARSARPEVIHITG